MPAKFQALHRDSRVRALFAEFVSSEEGIATLCALDGSEVPFKDERETNSGPLFYTWLEKTPEMIKRTLVLRMLNQTFGECH